MDALRALAILSRQNEPQVARHEENEISNIKSSKTTDEAIVAWFPMTGTCSYTKMV